MNRIEPLSLHAIVGLLVAALLAADSALAEVGVTSRLASECKPYFGQTPPGPVPEVFAPGIISLEGVVHGSIAFSPDGTEIYWVLQKGTPGECPRLMVAECEDGQWQAPSPVDVIEPYGASEIHMAPSGDRLYFVSSRPWPEQWGRQPESGTREALKVWCLEREGSTWSSPRALPLAANRDLGGVSSTRDGTLYAAGLRRIRVLPSGEYSGIEWLGTPLDVLEPGGQLKGGHPYVSPDESFVLYNDDWPGVAGYGVFVSFRNADDSWTEPVNILERLGLRRGGSVPVLSQDQECLFYY